MGDKTDKPYLVYFNLWFLIVDVPLMYFYRTLLQFMLRAEVLKLYRQMLRTTRQIPDQDYRQEMTEWVQRDFRKFKNETDEVCSCLLHRVYNIEDASVVQVIISVATAKFPNKV